MDEVCVTYTVRPPKKETRFYHNYISIGKYYLIMIYTSMEGPSCLLSFDTKHKIICSRMTGLGQLVQLHVRNDLRRIIVFVAMDVI